MVQDQSLPLVGVIGCTGHQGSSVLRTLLESGKFRVRGLSRNPKSAKVTELLKSEWAVKKSLLQADILEFDELRLETYEKAFKGLDFLFAMTNPSFDDPEQELRCGKWIADWCQKMKIKHLVWSSLPNVEKLTKGEMMVPHFTSKAKVEEYMKQLGLSFTALLPGFFLSNFLQSFKFLKVGDEWVLRLPLSPHCKLPMLDPGREMGPALLNILLHRDDFMNKSIPLYSEELTMNDIAKMMGTRARFEMLDAKELKRLPLQQRNPQLPDEMINMFMYFEKFGYYGGMTGIVNLKKLLKHSYEPVSDYLTQQKTRILLA